MSIASRWNFLHTGRTQVLRRARDAAALTIPSLLPEEGHTENSVLPQPYQSLGARGVNNLSSKLLLALLPPSTSFFRLTMDPTSVRRWEPHVPTPRRHFARSNRRS